MTLQRKTTIYHAGLVTGAFISISIASFASGRYILGALMLFSAFLVHAGTIGGHSA